MGLGSVSCLGTPSPLRFIRGVTFLLIKSPNQSNSGEARDARNPRFFVELWHRGSHLNLDVLAATRIS